MITKKTIRNKKIDIQMNKGKNWDRVTAIATAVLAIVAVGSTIYTNWSLHTLEYYQNRPYVGTNKITPIFTESEKPEERVCVIDADIQNFGILPAYDVRVSYTWKIQDANTEKVLRETKEQRVKELGCLFQNEKRTFKLYIRDSESLLNENNQLIIDYELRYLHPGRGKEKKTTVKCIYYYKKDLIIRKIDAN